MKRRAERGVWLVTVIVLAGAASARAQPGATRRPWELSVPAHERRMAEELFDQAVELHEQLLLVQAVARYEAALSHWENPRIRWNLALITEDLGQYLRAYEHLERALAWGPGALEAEHWQEITSLRDSLLERHLAVVEARCDQAGVEIALDGKPWFRGPGSARQVVLPGEHVITARKTGYFPMASNVVLPAGAQGALTVSLVEDRIVERRRWPRWKPWALVGAGTAVGALGAALELRARGAIQQVRDELDGRCDRAPTCEPGAPGSAYHRGLQEHRIATGAMWTAGAVAVAGAVLVYLNQPRSYRTENRHGGSFELMPMASAGEAGVSALFRF